MSNNSQASGRRLTDVDAFDSVRRERSNSLARTEGFLRDAYTPELTANEDEHEAQAAAYEQDDQRIQNEEDARDEEDRDYEYGFSSSQSSYASSWTDYSDAVVSSDEEDDNGAQDADDGETLAWRGRVSRALQNDEPGLRSHESASSTETDMSHPPYIPRSRRVVGPHDEDEDFDETENEEAEEAPHTPTASPKKNDAEDATTPNGGPTANSPPAFVQGSSSGLPQGRASRYRIPNADLRVFYSACGIPSPVKASDDKTIQNGDPSQSPLDAAVLETSPPPPAVLQPLDENQTPANPDAHDAEEGPSKGKDKGKGKAKEDSTPDKDDESHRSGKEDQSGTEEGSSKGKKRDRDGDPDKKHRENQPPSPRSPGRPTKIPRRK